MHIVRSQLLNKKQTAWNNVLGIMTILIATS